jgi:hypothetical protein
VSLRQASVETAEQFSERVNTDCSLVKPSQKLCTSFRSEVMDIINMSKIPEENVHAEGSPAR